MASPRIKSNESRFKSQSHSHLVRFYHRAAASAIHESNFRRNPLNSRWSRSVGLVPPSRAAVPLRLSFRESLSLLCRLPRPRVVTFLNVRKLRKLPLLLLLLKLTPSTVVGAVVATEGARWYGVIRADRGEISGDDDVGDVPERDTPSFLLLYSLAAVPLVTAFISSGNVNSRFRRRGGGTSSIGLVSRHGPFARDRSVGDVPLLSPLCRWSCTRIKASVKYLFCARFSCAFFL